MSNTGTTPEKSTLLAHLSGYPLLDALLNRRSRRFGRHMELNGGPLAYTSTKPLQPLTLEEEASLAFAAGGTTGYVLAELPYDTGHIPNAGSGNIITHFVGRTVASPDALHNTVIFVINDQGTWMLKRPQDYPRDQAAGLIQAAREHKFVELYEHQRVRIADTRIDVPRDVPYLPPFNKWSANLPGSTYFVPISEISTLYINLALSAFSEEFGYYIIDERNGFQPAGIAKFARSKGGHLDDNRADEHIATVGILETSVYELAVIEHGAILQNLGLMAQALGLGGFPHYAAHPYGWGQALGFRMEYIPFSKTSGANILVKDLLKILRQDQLVPTPIGLERDGQVLIKPFCPPYYRNMEEAVLAYIDYKYAAGSGTLRDGGAATAWQDGASVQAGIQRYSDRTIDATIAYLEYIYHHYGRVPSIYGPFRTINAFQAHHLDPDFYDRFYRPEALSETQRTHSHDGEAE